MMKDTFRIVTREAPTAKSASATTTRRKLCKRCTRRSASTIAAPTWALRGQPVFQGLIGPMPEGKNIIRYESPEVFETLTKEWSTAKISRRSRTKKPTAAIIDVAESL